MGSRASGERPRRVAYDMCAVLLHVRQMVKKKKSPRTVMGD